MEARVMSDDRVAVLCDLFEQVMGVPIEEHQLRSLAAFIKASTGPNATLARRAERWSWMGARVVFDAGHDFERMMREAHDIDAHWTAARSMPPPERLRWMRDNDFNIGESW